MRWLPRTRALAQPAILAPPRDCCVSGDTRDIEVFYESPRGAPGVAAAGLETEKRPDASSIRALFSRLPLAVPRGARQRVTA